MKRYKLLLIAIISTSSYSYAAKDGHTMLETCKAECPAATNEDDAHKCMKDVVKRKKGDKAFKKSMCLHAMQDHEKNEKSHDHKH